MRQELIFFLPSFALWCPPDNALFDDCPGVVKRSSAYRSHGVWLSTTQKRERQQTLGGVSLSLSLPLALRKVPSPPLAFLPPVSPNILTIRIGPDS